VYLGILSGLQGACIAGGKRVAGACLHKKAMNEPPREGTLSVTECQAAVPSHGDMPNLCKQALEPGFAGFWAGLDSPNISAGNKTAPAGRQFPFENRLQNRYTPDSLPDRVRSPDNRQPNTALRKASHSE
jgi:hypothetical protein